MEINFELYRIFYAVANNKSITKAAEELFISQPAVSKAIKNLEAALGGSLFNRTKKGVVLTEEGREFYNYIKSAMEYINNAQNKFNDLINLETGTVRIGISTTLTKCFLLPYIKEFNEKHPKIDIQIDTSISKELFNKLKNGLLDIVILNLPYKSENEIEIIKCIDVQDGFYASSKYKELKDKVISIKDLDTYPLLFMTKNSNTRNFLDSYLKENNIKLTPYMELAGYQLVLEFTKINLGIGYLTSEFIKAELDNDLLFEIKTKEKIPKRSIGIAYSKKNLPSFATKELIKIITKKTN